MNTQKLAVRFSIASAILFAALVVMQVTSGASQAYFEVVHPPARYAADLVARAGWLKIVIGVDDIFIGAYVGAVVFTVLALPRRAASGLVLAGGILIGLLDLEENHHILALLRAAENGLPIPAGDLIRRMDFSSAKFAVAHLSFFFLTWLIPGRTTAARALRILLGAIQLPLGIAGVIWDGAIPVQLGRGVCFTAAYVLLAVVIARLAPAALAAGSDARASFPDTRPGAAA